MLPLNQSRKIALIAVALFAVSMSILFIFTRGSGNLLADDLKTQLFGGYSKDSGHEGIKNTPDPAVVLTTDNKISYASPSFKELLGYSDQDITDIDFFKLLHPDDAGKVASFIAKLAYEKKELKNLGPYRIKDKAGQYRVYMASAAIISSESKASQVVITMTDITKSVEDINEANESGKPIKTMKDEPEKKIMVDKG